MTDVMTGRPHPSERDLVRYMDREFSDVERSRLRKHLDACSACASRLASMKARSDAVSAIFAAEAASIEVDPLVRARAKAAVRRANRAVVRRAPRRYAIRAAAAVALVVFGGLAANPLSAWVREHWLSHPASHAVAHTAPPPAAAPVEEQRRGPKVLFEPTTGVFEVSIAHPQAEGMIRLEMQDVARASAEVSNPGVESILILPSGLRVENAASSAASYTVTLPASLREVSVRVGDRTVATLVPDSTAGSVTREIPLAPPATGN